jgi:hypothetical protein
MLDNMKLIFCVIIDNKIVTKNNLFLIFSNRATSVTPGKKCYKTFSFVIDAMPN